MYGKSVHFVGVLVLFHSLLFFLHEDWRGETIDFRPKHFIAWEEGNSYYWNQRFPLMKPSASSKQWARKRRKKCWNLCIFPRFLSIKVTRDLRSVSRNKKNEISHFFKYRLHDALVGAMTHQWLNRNCPFEFGSILRIPEFLRRRHDGWHVRHFLSGRRSLATGSRSSGRRRNHRKPALATVESSGALPLIGRRNTTDQWRSSTTSLRYPSIRRPNYQKKNKNAAMEIDRRKR